MPSDNTNQTASTLDEHITKLRTANLDPELVASLNELTKAAVVGARYKKWTKRMVFGFSLTDAIERWILNFKPSREAPVNEWIPVEESKNVVAAWMRYNLYKAIVVLILSSLVTIVTAFFLYRQIGKQDELILVQEHQNGTENYLRNLRTLFEETCYLRDTLELPISQRVVVNTSSVSLDSEKEICLPIHNYRLRAESFKAIVMDSQQSIDIDLAHAHLSDIDFSGTLWTTSLLNFKEKLVAVSLERSVLHNLDMRGTDFTGTNLKDAIMLESNFERVNFEAANMTGASLVKSNLKSAYFVAADLSYANLRLANMEGAELSFSNLKYANLKGTNLTKTDILGAELECTNLTNAINVPENWEVIVGWEKESCVEHRSVKGWE